MNELLNNPAMQAGIAPFVVALIVALLFRKAGLSGLAIIAGFAVMIHLVSGWAFEPLTSSRKLIWLGMASGLLAIPLSYMHGRWWRPVLTVLAGVAALWMSMRILQQQSPVDALRWGAGCVLYTGWLVYWMDELKGSPVRAATAGTALGFGTGAAVLIGASALLGQYGLSLGAAASACLLIVFVSNGKFAGGRNFTLPLGFISGLIGCLAVLTAQLPWYSLPLLAVIPLVAKLPVSGNARLQTVVLSVATLLCAAVAVYLSFRINGLPPF